MTGPFADRLFQISFALAGCYNMAFGLWAGFWPNEFFDRFEIAQPRYPGIWACLGMVVGVYGFLYLHASWKLATAWPIIAVGLLGKALGPIGMIASFSDEWPRRLGMICVTNDIVWWLPFGLFLIRGSRLAKFLESNAPLICATLHALALLLCHRAPQRNGGESGRGGARAIYRQSRARVVAGMGSVDARRHEHRSVLRMVGVCQSALKPSH